MTQSIKRILSGLALFLLTVAGSTIGYELAGWTFVDAFYMVIITVFGVGYGEVRALDTPALKMFTVVVIVAGTSASVYTISGVIQFFTEGELRRALGARRMSSGIEKLNGHTIICGFGRLGQVLASELHAARAPYLIIDREQERCKRAEADGALVFCGNASDEEVLLSVGVNRARALATCLPDDAANVFITLTARNLNKDIGIIARAEAPTTRQKLLQAGANHVVLPATIGAQKIAEIILHPETSGVLSHVTRGGSFAGELEQIGLQLAEVPLGPEISGHLLGDVEVRGDEHFVIVAVRRTNGETLNRPRPDVRLTAGDVLLAVGPGNERPAVVLHPQC